MTAPAQTSTATRVSFAGRAIPLELGLAAFVVAHVVLALIMRVRPELGALHAVACLGAGLYIAARHPLHHVAYVVSYIAGAEVLWRMTRAGVFWEFGKYAIAGVLLIGLLRLRGRRNRVLAFTYFALLVPSAVLTLLSYDFNNARQQISFNLSGPLALALCVAFFSNVRITRDQLRGVLFAAIGPVVGIATLAYYATATARDLTFVGDSNSVTSGGFGPNQVSAMLGMGLLFALLLLLERKMRWSRRAPLLVLAVALAAQSALTFSRGGLAIAFASAFAAIFYLVRERRTRVTLMVLAALLFGIGKYVVVPQLDAFTSGKLVERYTSGDPSRRGLLATFDLQIFVDHPVLGVGPGAAGLSRQEMGRFGAAHTEFTRLLAEHGILGGVAIVLLFVLGYRLWRAARNLEDRAFIVAMLSWVALFLLINAMRLAAPAALLGLACAVAYSSAGRAPRRPAT